MVLEKLDEILEKLKQLSPEELFEMVYRSGVKPEDGKAYALLERWIRKRGKERSES